MVERIDELREIVLDARERGLAVALVPTMGFLHEGHLRLVDEARRHAGGGLIVLSIFVNPTQFAPDEDYARYPRDPAGDAAKASARGVDLLFTPPLEEMYGADRAVGVVPLALAERWEGAARPGHFAGVLTVVAKLFNIVQPGIAAFGQKDIQQATLLRAMVRDLDFPVEILVVPTVRERDGLALSSRNAYLSSDERRRALVLSRALGAVAAAFRAGERDARLLAAGARRVLAEEPLVDVEYLAIADPERLEPVSVASAGTVVAVAGSVGGTRLIDNVILGEP